MLGTMGMDPSIIDAASQCGVGLFGAISDQLVAEMGNWHLWVVVATSMAAGAFGGLIFELLSLQGNIEVCHKPDNEEQKIPYSYARGSHLLDLGIWARLIVGAGAALAVLLVISPTSVTQLLAITVVAGSAGTAVFRSLQDRLTAAIAQTNLLSIQEQAGQIEARLEELQDLLNQGERDMQRDANSAGIQQFQKLLDETRGMARLMTQARGRI